MVSGRRALYVEGGGDKNPSLASECRKAFSKLFEKAGITLKPRVIVCGGRKNAYDQFRHAQEAGDAEASLLVDAEALPALEPHDSPWDHVKKRLGDGWERPPNATDDQLHFMTVCMETWLIADLAALKDVFGPKLDASKLPSATHLESTEKQAVFRALEAATKLTRAGAYGKGAHSFRVLERVSPAAIRGLKWGKRFLDAMGASK